MVLEIFLDNIYGLKKIHISRHIVWKQVFKNMQLFYESKHFKDVYKENFLKVRFNEPKRSIFLVYFATRPTQIDLQYNYYRISPFRTISG